MVIAEEISGQREYFDPTPILIPLGVCLAALGFCVAATRDKDKGPHPSEPNSPVRREKYPPRTNP